MKQSHMPKLLRPELHRRVGNLLKNDPDAEDEGAFLALWEEIEGGNKERIPPERRTIPMSKKIAARLMGYTRVVEDWRERRAVKDAVEILTKSIDDGLIKAERHSRQRFVFDRNDFPPDVWYKILPKNSP
jgi:hypothetical protein